MYRQYIIQVDPLDFNLIKLTSDSITIIKFHHHNTFCIYHNRLQPTSSLSLSKDTVELVQVNKQFILIKGQSSKSSILLLGYSMDTNLVAPF